MTTWHSFCEDVRAQYLVTAKLSRKAYDTIVPARFLLTSDFDTTRESLEFVRLCALGDILWFDKSGGELGVGGAREVLPSNYEALPLVYPFRAGMGGTSFGYPAPPIDAAVGFHCVMDSSHRTMTYLRPLEYYVMEVVEVVVRGKRRSRPLDGPLRHLVLVARGTESAVEAFSQLVTGDATALMMSRGIPKGYAAIYRVPTTGQAVRCMEILTDFLTNLGESQPEEERPGARMTMCGHSYGGTLAVVCGHMYTDLYSKTGRLQGEVDVWAFGMPPLHNSILSTYENTFPDLLRLWLFINREDCVPSLRFPSFDVLDTSTMAYLVGWKIRLMRITQENKCELILAYQKCSDDLSGAIGVPFTIAVNEHHAINNYIENAPDKISLQAAMSCDLLTGIYGDRTVPIYGRNGQPPYMMTMDRALQQTPHTSAPMTCSLATIMELLSDFSVSMPFSLFVPIPYIPRMLTFVYQLIPKFQLKALFPGES